MLQLQLHAWHKLRCLADLAKECTIVFALLYDDASLEQAAGAFLAAGPPKGTIFTNCATVYPGCTDALATRAAEAGVIFLSAPIFGRPDAILAHKGLLVSAGPEEGRQRVGSPHPRSRLEFLIFSVSLSSSLLVS